MIGQTLGRYRVESKLGQGGMGTAYRARDLHLDRVVAIKVLPLQPWRTRSESGALSRRPRLPRR